MNKFNANLTSFYPDAGETARNVGVGIPDLKHVRRVRTRTVKEQLRIANAAKHLQAIPDPGESVHIVCKGNFAAWDFVHAALRIAAPATIKRLDIVTLGFSKKNIAELATMLDAGTVGEASFIFSCYFKSTSASDSEFLFEQLPRRGVKIAAVRSHAKLLLVELSTGEHVVIETSANLRSCHNIEQFTICDDRELLLFHRQWITQVIEEAHR